MSKLTKTQQDVLEKMRSGAKARLCDTRRYRWSVEGIDGQPTRAVEKLLQLKLIKIVERGNCYAVAIFDHHTAEGSG